jgi:ribosome-associated toxin RatA of RatAB toxin-antitoxin module
MQEYEQSKAVAAPANEVFAWVSDVENLPKYLPPIKDAGIEGSAAAGSPGERVKMTVEIPDRGEFESEGYFDVDAEARTMRWGAETDRDYSGWLTVAEAGDGQSEVTVHLSFGPRSVEGEIQEDSSDDRDPLEESLDATLESIRRQIEEGSGKLPPPSPED